MGRGIGQRLRQGLGACQVDIDDDDLRAGLGKGAGARFSNAAGAARDEGNFAV